MDVERVIGKHAIAKTAVFPHPVMGQGTVIACCDAPMVCIEKEDGTCLWWRADLCEFDDVEAEKAA
jgi:hypothetical protein